MLSPGPDNKLPIRIEGIQPILSVTDMPRSRNFYVTMLGFEEAPWGDDNFTSVSKDAGSLYLCKGAQGNQGTWIWIGFDGDIFEFYRNLKQ